MKIPTQYPHNIHTETIRLLLCGIMGVVVGFAGTVFILTLVHAVGGEPNSELSVPAEIAATSATSSLPRRLLIPSVGIDANVQHVGVGKSGNMAVPTNYTDAGWYRYGTTPGFPGSAVMDGHVDNELALPGVFKRLSEIKKGDHLYVLTKDGSAIDFVVTDMQLYPYNAAPTDLIFNRKDKARLNLITCDGAWIAGKKTYDKRLVIFAELR